MTTENVIKRIDILANNSIPKDGESPYTVNFNPTNWYEYTSLWGGYTNMLPFEGYLRGYRYDITQSDQTGNNNPYKVNIGEPASLLNLPEFAMQLFTDIQSGNFSKSNYIFLNTFPFNPPVGLLDGQSEATSAYLFKNSAGNYSIPLIYQYWLGGMWKFRQTTSARNFTTDIFLETTNENTKVVNTLDKEGMSSNTVYDLLTYNDANKRMIFNNTGLTYNKFYVQRNLPQQLLFASNPTVPISSPRINGIGIFSSLISSLFPFFNNALNLPTNTNDAKFLPLTNITDLLASNLRVFTSYFYLNESKTNTMMVCHGVYGIGGYVANNEVQFIKNIDSPFLAYCSAWRYCNTQYLSKMASSVITTNLEVNPFLTDAQQKTAECIYTTITQLSSSMDDEDVTSITNHIFKEYDVVDSVYKKESSGNFVDKILQSNADPRKVLMEFIAHDVVQMNNNFVKYALNDSDLLALGVNNKDFYCVLYPSAGGTYWLPGLLNDTFGFKHNRAYPIENALLNSCKLLWYTGPASSTYLNSLYASINDSVDLGDFINKDMLFNNQGQTDLYPNILSNLDRYALYNLYEFYEKDSELHSSVPKTDRAYVITGDGYDDKEPLTIFSTENLKNWISWISNQKNYVAESPFAPIPINSMVDYLGTGFLDVCEDAYNQPSTSNMLLNTILSLTVVDKNDFDEEITVGGVIYDKDQQIEILSKYNTYLDTMYVLEHYNEVMNVSLSRAQANKSKAVINALLKQRDLITIGSVLDTIDSNGVRNGFINQMIVDADNTEWTSTGTTLEMRDYIRKSIFGTGNVPLFTNTDNRIDDYAKYIFRGPMESKNYLDVDRFYSVINVAPTLNNIKISCEYAILYYRTYIKLKQRSGTTPALVERDTLKVIYDKIHNLRVVANEQIEVYLANLSAGLKIAYDAKVAEEQKTREEDKKNQSFLSDDLLKTKTYYNVKALYDNWISMGYNGGLDGKVNKMNLFFNYNTVTTPTTGNWIDNQEDTRKLTLYEQFLFVDRASRNIGSSLLVNINWMSDFLNNNVNAENVSIYTFFSELAKQHSCVLHTLPFFITFDGTLNASKSASDLFDTFDSNIEVEKKPKFIFQFIGNTTSELNTPSNYSKRTQSKAWHIGECPNKSGLISEFPLDMQTDASAIAFIVDFGAPNQQIFSNLQLDQSEFQNTEEYFKLITDVTSKGPRINSSDLFSIFSSRSYTAQIDCMGNMMIQPLMYFDLVNIPLFDGTYWITNVKHTITPNNIKTSFKGVRQPIASVPLRGDVLKQLVNNAINDLLDIPSLAESITSAAPPSTKISTAEQLVNQKKVKDYLKSEELSQVAVAGIMGNIYEESKFNPTASWTDVNGKTSYGLIQWNGAFGPNDGGYDLSKLGRTVETQMPNLVNGFTYGYLDYYNEVKNNENKGAKWTAYRFAALVEKCSLCTKTYEDYEKGGEIIHKNGSAIKVTPMNRSIHAEEFYRRFNDPNDVLYWGKT